MVVFECTKCGKKVKGKTYMDAEIAFTDHAVKYHMHGITPLNTQQPAKKD